MSERAWKLAERRIAELLGGHRGPVSCQGQGDTPAIEHPTLSVEVRSRETLPAWIREAMEWAEASALPAQLPIAVLHRVGDRYADALVVVRLKRFE